MSVINQVLNQLEQRGASGAAEQPMVRAVQHTRRDFLVPLLAIGLMLAVGIAAWQWMSSRDPSDRAASAAIKSGNPQLAGGGAELTPPKAPQEQSATTTTAPEPEVLAADTQTGLFVPASRLSLELSSVPLPSSLRSFDKTQDRLLSGQALREGNGKPATNPAAAVRPRTGAPVMPHPAPVSAKAKVAAHSTGSAVPMKQVSTAQQADAEFRRAAGLMQQGRIAEAIAGYEAALRLDAGHEAARQALVALLLEGKRNADAERVLLEGLNIKPDHTEFTMLLARLQVERGALEQATLTLEKSLPFAETQADYRAFLAALLQRQNRNEEAISQYQIVAQHAPNNGVWLMGYGISLQAVQRNAEAKAMFQHALDTKTLSPELQAFVQQKLKGL